MQLSLTNVINISVAQVQQAANEYNTSNVALFSDEAPNLETFGDLGYAIYLGPQQVGIDFGTSSKTFQMATAAFSQQPNVLNNNGSLIVVLMHTATQTIAFSGVAASGAFEVTFGGNNSASIMWNATANQIQTILQAVAGLAAVTVTGSIASQSLVIQMAGVYGAAPSVFTFATNTLETSGSTAITLTPTITTPGESVLSCLTRTQSLVQYFGIMVSDTLASIGQTDLLAVAAVVQTLNAMLMVVSFTAADVAPGGMIDMLRTGSFTQTRGLFYDDSTVNGQNALNMIAAYTGRAFSTNFSGSNTTQTMHLKPLLTIQPDPNMTQTIFNQAVTAGADTYPSLQGVPAVFCSGTNSFFDDVYNLQWAVGALQISGFNFLAQAASKVPQTEAGMDGLKGAYRQVCQQAVNNQYLAPGTWNSPTTFGNQAQFLKNIAQFGYYIYSTPVSQQSQTDRANRKAPLVQIAFKLAGAIQSSDVIVYVNA